MATVVVVFLFSNKMAEISQKLSSKKSKNSKKMLKTKKAKENKTTKNKNQF